MIHPIDCVSMIHKSRAYSTSAPLHHRCNHVRFDYLEPTRFKINPLKSGAWFSSADTQADSRAEGLPSTGRSDPSRR